MCARGHPLRIRVLKGSSDHCCASASRIKGGLVSVLDLVDFLQESCFGRTQGSTRPGSLLVGACAGVMPQQPQL